MLPGIGYFVSDKLNLPTKPQYDEYLANDESLMQDFINEKTSWHLYNIASDTEPAVYHRKHATTLDVKKVERVNEELNELSAKQNFSSEFPNIKRYLKRSSRFIKTIGSVLSKEKEEAKCKKISIFKFFKLKKSTFFP